MNDPIDIQAAKRFARDGKNLFIAGRAGTGKSTLMRTIRDLLVADGKKVVTLAPTGLAAYNVDGQTIHSFFRFPLGLVTKKDAQTAAWNYNNPALEVMRSLDVIIIDEISMVRADVAWAICETLTMARKVYGQPKKLFGGAQIILVGDMMQLPPVVKADEEDEILKRFGGHYFFDVPEYTQNFYFVELTKVWRQNDADLSETLNAIRIGNFDSGAVERINNRVAMRPEDSITLTATRAEADRINNEKIDALPGGVLGAFGATTVGRIYPADVPVDQMIPIAIGARVMACVNDPDGDYFNGDMGTVASITEIGPAVAMDRGHVVTFVPHKFTKNEFVVEKGGGVSLREVGSCSQIPIRLAWAVTAHKSQGLTLPRVHVALGGTAFVSGQVYVALSRCTSWAGLTLERPITEEDVICDTRAGDFRRVMRSALHDMNKSLLELAPAV